MKKKKFKFAPLNSAFMATSMLGAVISIMYVLPNSFDWGVAFALIFVVMFVASLISMSSTDPDAFISMEDKKRKKKKFN